MRPGDALVRTLVFRLCRADDAVREKWDAPACTRAPAPALAMALALGLVLAATVGRTAQVLAPLLPALLPSPPPPPPPNGPLHEHAAPQPQHGVSRPGPG